MPVRRDEETSLTLLARINAGEDASWTRLIRLYEPLVRYWCMRWGVSDEELADLAQEVWLAIGPTLSGYQGGNGRSFRSWLRGVTHHKIQDWHRRQARQLAEAEGGSVALDRLEQFGADLDESDPGNYDEKAESQALYRRALLLVKDEFEPRTWNAFLGYAIEAKSAADVGAELGLSTASVRMAKSRVLNRLRQELGELID